MSPSPSGYDPIYFEPLFAVEDRHFWFQARNHLLTGLLQSLVKGLTDDYRVLEVGCGTGNVLKVMEKVCSNGRVFGMDLFNEGLHFARRRVQCPLLQGDLLNPPFGVKFDLIGLFDVLEHIEDDEGVLAALRGMLKPGGALLLTVPAGPELWSYFDLASRHVRRYTMTELSSRIHGAGMEIQYTSHYMASIYPLVWAARKLANIRSAEKASGETGVQALAEEELKITPGLNELLTWWLKHETGFLLRRRKLPFGTSIVTIARRS